MSPLEKIGFDGDREKAWIQEAARRDAELEAGEVKAVPAETVFRRVKSALR
jgi:hypothetical protein